MGACCTCLDGDEFSVLDYPNKKEIRNGPGAFSFCCAKAEKRKKPRLTNTQYIVVKHLNPRPDGSLMEIVSGPTTYNPDDPYADISEVREKPNLSATQYVIVTNNTTGVRRVEGPPDDCSLPSRKLFRRRTDGQSE